jgi:DNA polymerase III delta subunit
MSEIERKENMAKEEAHKLYVRYGSDKYLLQRIADYIEEEVVNE